MDQRFFVTVITKNRHAFLHLRHFGYDLFEESVQGGDEKAYTIDGLLTLEEVGKLVENDYSVLVREDAAKKAYGRLEVIEFDEWLKGMEG